jgi:hydrogenase maturation factor HypE
VRSDFEELAAAVVELSELLQVVYRSIKSLGRAGDLVGSFDVEVGSAGAPDNVVELKLSERARVILAAVRTANRDLGGVRDLHREIVASTSHDHQDGASAQEAT